MQGAFAGPDVRQRFSAYPVREVRKQEREDEVSCSAVGEPGLPGTWRDVRNVARRFILILKLAEAGARTALVKL
jgi:hypothetical protein